MSAARVVVFSAVWLFVSPVLAASPDPSLFGAGSVDGCGMTYTLRYSPLANASSTDCWENDPDDRDHDGLLDMAEAELMWAFSPYIVWHSDEWSWMKEDVVLVYQVLPSVKTATTMTLELRLIFLLHGDYNPEWPLQHGGDSQRMSIFIESDIDLSGAEPLIFQKWRLKSVYFPGFSNKLLGQELQEYCDAMMTNWTPDIAEQFNIEWYFNQNMNGIAQQSIDPRRDSGLAHIKVYIAEGKHALYDNMRSCDHSHGGQMDECGGGPEGLILSGIPSVALGTYPGWDGQDYTCTDDFGYCFDGYGQWESMIGAMRNADSNAFEAVVYAGNLGEKDHLNFDDLGINGKGWFQDEKVTRGCFCGGLRDDDMSDNCGSSCVCGSPNENIVEDVEAAVDIECAGSILGLMKAPVDLLTGCVSRDIDADGIPDEVDCDPLNPYLLLDMDQDGVCDTPSTNADACMEWCQHNGDGSIRQKKCEFNCSNRDSCVPEENSICGTLSALLLTGETTVEENAEVIQHCKMIYGNSLIEANEIKTETVCGDYTFTRNLLQVPGSCQPETWGYVDADIKEASVLSMKRTEEETVLPSGQTVTLPRFQLMKCTVPVLETTLYRREGSYRWVDIHDASQGIVPADAQGSPISVDYPEHPGSVMACGCDGEFTGNEDCEERICPINEDAGLFAEQLPWKSEQIPEQLQSVLGSSYGMVADQGESYRHKSLNFAPRPSTMSLSNRWLDSRYNSARDLTTKIRFSYPKRDASFNGLHTEPLLSDERSLSAELSAMKTSLREICRRTTPQDFALPDSIDTEELGQGLIDEMSPIKVIPGAERSFQRLFILRKAPEGSTAVAMVQPLVGGNLIETVPLPLVDTRHGISVEALAAGGIIPISLPVPAKKSLHDAVSLEGLLIWPEGGQTPYVAALMGSHWEISPLSELSSSSTLPVFNQPPSVSVADSIVIMAGTTADGTPTLIGWDTLKKTQSFRHLPTDFLSLEGKSTWFDTTSQRVYFFGGEASASIPFITTWGQEQELVLHSTIDFGQTPSVTSGREVGEVFVLNRQQHALWSVNLRTGSATAIELPPEIDEEIVDVIHFDPLGDSLLMPESPSSADATQLVIQGLAFNSDGSVSGFVQSKGPVVEEGTPLYPENGLGLVEEESMEPKESGGCGCRIGHPAQGDPSHVLLLLLAFGAILRRRKHR